MIRLQGKSEVDDVSNKIIFEPRRGYGRRAKVQEFPLIYGHRCPECSNVIQALFKAPKSFSLWPYEETVILSQGEKNSGEIRKVFPDDHTKPGKSCYRMNYSPAEGGSIKLVLRNHIMNHRVIVERKFDGAGIWEVGFERPCTYAGVFALREDLLIKDWLLFGSVTEYDIAKYNIPKIKDLIPATNVQFKLVPAVGAVPPVILVDKQNFVYGYNYYTKPLMEPFLKSKQ